MGCFVAALTAIFVPGWAPLIEFMDRPQSENELAFGSCPTHAASTHPFFDDCFTGSFGGPTSDGQISIEKVRVVHPLSVSLKEP